MLAVAACFTSLFSFAQQTTTSSKDSTEFYEKEFLRLRNEALSQMQQSADYKALQQRFKVHQQRSTNYIGTTFFVDRAQGDFSALNQSITAIGFSPLNEVTYRIGIGISAKSQRAIVDFNYFAFAIERKATKGNEAIKANWANVLQMDIGYAAVQSRAFNLYPYAGLSLRVSSLQYDNKGQANTNPTNITDMFTNRQQFYLSNFRVGYQAGLGFDLAVAQTKEGTGAILFFTKAGINRPLWKEKYEKDGARIDPKVNFAEWMVTAGLKFVRRR